MSNFSGVNLLRIPLTLRKMASFRSFWLVQLLTWCTLSGIHRLVLGLFAAEPATADDKGDELWGGLSSLLPPTRREAPPCLALPSSIMSPLSQWN